MFIFLVVWKKTLKKFPLIFGLILCVILSDERYFTLIWCKYELNWSVLWIFNRVHIQDEKQKCILINSLFHWKFVYLFLIIYDAIYENLFGFVTDRNIIYYAKQTVHNDAIENAVEVNVYECKTEFRCTTFTFRVLKNLGILK